MQTPFTCLGSKEGFAAWSGTVPGPGRAPVGDSRAGADFAAEGATVVKPRWAGVGGLTPSGLLAYGSPSNACPGAAKSCASTCRFKQLACQQTASASIAPSMTPQCLSRSACQFAAVHLSCSAGSMQDCLHSQGRMTLCRVSA